MTYSVKSVILDLEDDESIVSGASSECAVS